MINACDRIVPHSPHAQHVRYTTNPTRIKYGICPIRNMYKMWDIPHTLHADNIVYHIPYIYKIWYIPHNQHANKRENRLLTLSFLLSKWTSKPAFNIEHTRPLLTIFIAHDPTLVVESEKLRLGFNNRKKYWLY